jgi:hypothetical protein
MKINELISEDKAGGSAEYPCGGRLAGLTWEKIPMMAPVGSFLKSVMMEF